MQEKWVSVSYLVFPSFKLHSLTPAAFAPYHNTTSNYWPKQYRENSHTTWPSSIFTCLELHPSVHPSYQPSNHHFNTLGVLSTAWSIFRSRKKGKKQYTYTYTYTARSSFALLQSDNHYISYIPHIPYISYHAYIVVCRMKEWMVTSLHADAAPRNILSTMSLSSPSINIRQFIPDLLSFYPNHTTQHPICFTCLLWVMIVHFPHHYQQKLESPSTRIGKIPRAARHHWCIP